MRDWCKGVHRVDLGESSPHAPFLNLLFEQIANSNEYLLAKFGFDTAENEPSKVCPIERQALPRSCPALRSVLGREAEGLASVDERRSLNSPVRPDFGRGPRDAQRCVTGVQVAALGNE